MNGLLEDCLLYVSDNLPEVSCLSHPGASLLEDGIRGKLESQVLPYEASLFFSMQPDHWNGNDCRDAPMNPVITPMTISPRLPCPPPSLST